MADGQGELKNRNARAIYQTLAPFNYFFPSNQKRHPIRGQFGGRQREYKSNKNKKHGQKTVFFVVGRGYILPKPSRGSLRQGVALWEKQGTYSKISTPQGWRELPRKRKFFLLSLPTTQKALPDRGIAFWWWEEVDSNYRSQ